MYQYEVHLLSPHACGGRQVRVLRGRREPRQDREAPALRVLVHAEGDREEDHLPRRVTRGLGLHTSWGGGQFRHPDFPKSLGNRENPRFFIENP